MAETLSLKLSYFDFDGGRGEPARVALSVANIPFEDDRIGGRAWAELKAETTFASLPILSINGTRVNQSNAINRYVGLIAGLYPTTVFEALYADEAMDAVESLNAHLDPTIQIKDLDERIAARKKALEGGIGVHLRGLTKLLARGGEWFADGRFTIADLKVAEMTRHLSAGILDGIPKDYIRENFPELAAHFTRVREIPGVRAYYEKRAAIKAARS